VTTTVRPPSPAAAGKPRMVVSVKRLFRAESGEYVVMVATVLFLVAFGLVMVLSSSFVGSALGNDGNFFATFVRQALWAMLGIPLMLMVSRLKPIQIKRATPAVFLAALVFQALVFSVFGITEGGNRAWVNIAGFSGQPSEILKVALIAWMAAILSDRIDYLHDYRVLLRPLAVGVAVAIGLVVAGRDLGTVGIMTMIAVGVAFLAGIRLSHLAAVMGIFGAFLGLFAAISPSRVTRIMTWFSGCTEEDYQDVCWQIIHSTYALGSGGLLGVGLGNSRAKWSWLPAAETDFIFAIVGEELGLAGTTLIVVAFIVLAIAMARMVRAQQDPFARIVTGGVMVWLIGQALVNIAVVLEFLPVLGVPLPFMSMGGSALISSLIAIGLVMALNRTGSESVTDYRARRRATTR
jgi:cell division protein FtsW